MGETTWFPILAKRDSCRIRRNEGKVWAISTLSCFILLVTKLEQLWAKRSDIILGNVVVLILAFTSMACWIHPETAVLLTNLKIADSKIAVKDTDIDVCLGYQWICSQWIQQCFDNLQWSLPHTLLMLLSNETSITTAFPVSATNSEDL